MALIFSASTDTLSSNQTSRFLRPFLLWLKPDLSETAVSEIQAMVRKGGHVTEYAVLAVLLWRALSPRPSLWSAPWNPGAAGWAVVICAIYAASDEFHQSFYPSREASVRDVALDTGGAIFALAILWMICRRRPQLE